jgi:hypothetical protein
VPSSARAMNWSKNDVAMKDQPSPHPVQFEIKQNGSPIERKVSVYYIYDDERYILLLLLLVI